MKKIIKASAGTGKTFSLALEYINRVLLGDNVEEIYVMTFTNKATFEIKERILNFLKLMQDKNSEVSKVFMKKFPDTNISTDVLNITLKNLLINKEHLKVSTIDSFIKSIFDKLSYEKLNIYNYNINLNEKQNEIEEKILQRIINSESLFNKFKNFFKEFRARNIEDYLKIINDILSERWKFEILDSFEEKQLSKETDFMLYINEILYIIKNFAEEKNDLHVNYLAKDYMNLYDVDLVQYIEKNHKIFFRTSGNIWNGQKTRGKANEKIKESLEENQQYFLRNLSNHIYNTKVIPYEKVFYDISKTIFMIYDNIKYGEKEFNNNDINFYTSSVLKKSEYVKDGKITNEFFDLIGSEIKTIFIDEFQDTSILQWSTLKPIINKAQNVVIVGDEKQAIYAWRGGEKKLFEKLDIIINAEIETLGTSFRTNENIMNFINKYFFNIENWDYKEVSSVNKDDNSYLEINLLNTNDKTENVASKIAESILNKKYSEIGVIARNNKDLYELSYEFDRRNIPYVLQSSTSIIDHKAVNSIYKLIHYLVYEDYFSLLDFLRSDIVNLKGKEFKKYLERKNEIEKYLALESDIILEGIDTKTLDKIKNIKSKSFKIQCKMIIEEFGIIDIYNVNSDIENILYFYSFINNFNSFIDVLNYIEENKENEELKIRSIEDLNAVKLMTIHKSKGLEFKTEYYYHKVKQKSQDRYGFRFYLDLNKDFSKIDDYVLMPSKFKFILPHLDKDWREIYNKKQEEEIINNYYVGLTRPKDNLYIFIDCNNTKTLENDFFTKRILEFVNETNIEEDKRFFYGKEENKTLEEIDAENFSFSFGDAFNQNEEFLHIKSYNKNLENEFKRKKGLALHEYFENIYAGTLEEKQIAKEILFQKYGNMLGYDDLNNIFEKADNFIEKNQIYFNDNWEIFNEYDIFDKNGKMYRIDRLLLNKKNKEIVILDYKSGKAHNKNQLEEYKKILLDNLDDEYKISTEFLFV